MKKLKLYYFKITQEDVDKGIRKGRINNFDILNSALYRTFDYDWGNSKDYKLTKNLQAQIGDNDNPLQIGRYGIWIGEDEHKIKMERRLRGN